MMNRRDVLNLAVTSGTISGVLPSVVQAAARESRLRIVDTNVSLFRWPFRRLPLDETEVLVRKLSVLGISEAWAGSFEGVLQRDIAGVNSRLMEVCRQYSMLTPIGSVNPALPDWKEDIRRCAEDYKMAGIRLHPNYHGYTLDDPLFAGLLKTATNAGCFVQIVVAVEDIRTQHHQLQVQDVDLGALANCVADIGGARVQILNYRPRGAVFQKLASTPGVYFDTARVDSTDGVPNLMTAASGRVLFGSHAPFLIPEAALIRLNESEQLDEDRMRKVLFESADENLMPH